MNIIDTPAPAEVRSRISELRRKLAEAQIRVKEAVRNSWAVEEEIKILQAQCPHENVGEYFVQDVAEMKSQRFCKDCGAKC